MGCEGGMRMHKIHLGTITRVHTMSLVCQMCVCVCVCAGVVYVVGHSQLLICVHRPNQRTPRQ